MPESKDNRGDNLISLPQATIMAAQAAAATATALIAKDLSTMSAKVDHVEEIVDSAFGATGFYHKDQSCTESKFSSIGMNIKGIWAFISIEVVIFGILFAEMLRGGH